MARDYRYLRLKEALEMVIATTQNLPAPVCEHGQEVDTAGAMGVDADPDDVHADLSLDMTDLLLEPFGYAGARALLALVEQPNRTKAAAMAGMSRTTLYRLSAGWRLPPDTR